MMCIDAQESDISDTVHILNASLPDPNTLIIKENTGNKLFEIIENSSSTA